MDSAGNSSLQTVDEYSIISHPQPGSSSDSSDFSAGVNISGDLGSFPLENGEATGNEHLPMSYHALVTAYEHVKRRLSEREMKCDSLKRRLRASASSGNSTSMTHSTSSQFMSSNFEAEVTKAWEAFRDKCKECEDLRDELRTANHKVIKTQNDLRTQSRNEELIRAQSQLNEYKKRLQQAELQIHDHKSKQEMAQEELEKEKEFHERVLLATKERHEEMESTIESLRNSLQDKDRLQQELSKDLSNQMRMMQNVAMKRENELKLSLREMEEKVVQEREERSQLEQWKAEMERFHLSSGIPLSISHIPDTEKEETGSDYCDITVDDLLIEIRELTKQINELKQPASIQSRALWTICQNPDFKKSLVSTESSFSSELQNVFRSPSFQYNDQHMASQTPSCQPSLDARMLVEPSPPSSDEFFGNRPSMTYPRQIEVQNFSQTALSKASRNPRKLSGTKLPHTKSNLQNMRSSSEILHHANVSAPEENSLLYYSAVEDIAKVANQQPASDELPSEQSSDEGSNPSSANLDTSTHSTVTSSILESNEFSNRATSDAMSTPHQSSSGAVSTSNSTDDAMQTIFNKNDGSCSKSSYLPLRAPVSFVPSGPPVSVFSSNSDENVTVQSTSRVHSQQRPTTPGSNDVQSSSVTSPGRRMFDQTPTDEVQVQETHALMNLSLTSLETCPVCGTTFSFGTSESFMSLHINGHFSDDENMVGYIG